MKAVVTGGGGFVGRALTERLLARGDAVRIVARGRYPEIEALGAESVVHDLRDPAGLAGVVAGADVVFHVAARAGVWGPREEFFSINVEGTSHLLAASRTAGVRHFVYTSSPSVTFDGKDAQNVTEADCARPAHFEAFYAESKAVAERLVLEADGDGLRTTALRPHLVYGPGDPHLVPRIINRARQGRLAQVGDGTNKVALTFVDNAALAHVQAADALLSHACNAGRAYFVTDGPPVVLWEWVDTLWQGVGLPPVRRQVSVGTARAAGSVLETAWRWFGLSGEPPMTRFVAAELASSHWYDLGAARRDFGYTPEVEGHDGLRRTIEAFRQGEAHS